MRDRLAALSDRQCRNLLWILYGSYDRVPEGRSFMERLRDGIEHEEKCRTNNVQSLDKEMR